MRIILHATMGSFEADEFALVLGLTGIDPNGAEHYLIVQRALDGGKPEEDWGVHIEFDDQINGQYDRVQKFRLSRERLSVDLTEQLGTLAGVEGFDVELDLDDSTFALIRTGMPRNFRGTIDVLAIEE